MHALGLTHSAQELAPHTAPLFVAAVRLLPAGAVLVAWAAAQGRPQPRGRAAWLAIAAFALADGACFQARAAAALSPGSALLRVPARVPLSYGMPWRCAIETGHGKQVRRRRRPGLQPASS